MEEIKETVVDNPYGFIYITTNLINGIRYLGQKTFDKNNDWKYYLGSGIYFKNALQFYGRENFSRNIVCFCYSQDELNEVEYDLSVFFDVVESPNWYNLCYGGGGASGYHHSEESKQRMSEAKRNQSEETRLKMSQTRKGRTSPRKGVKLSDETKELMSASRKGKYVGTDNPFFGKTHTDEVKEQIRKYAQNRPSDVNEKISKSHMIPIVQLDKQENFIKQFDSAKTAQQETNIDAGHINDCCRKNRKSAGGYMWVYAKEYYNTQQNN